MTETTEPWYVHVVLDKALLDQKKRICFDKAQLKIFLLATLKHASPDL